MLRSVKDFEDEGKLSTAEAMLIDAVQNGQPCVLQDDLETVPEADDNPAHTIRADLLALLITGDSKDCGLSPFGVNLYGAYITGKLRLTHMRAVGETGLQYCRFAEELDMRSAHFQALNLTGSHLPGLFAQGAKVGADMFLRGITATGTVDLGGAKIGGQLDCEGATLNGAGGKALNAQGAEVGEGLFLTSITATGAVDVNSAKIGGQLACVGATLDGAGGMALNAQGAEVGASLFLRGITATGTVVAVGAKIGGQLVCDGATLNGAGGEALNTQGAELGADLFLRGITATGTVAVNSAKIGGQLSFRGATLDGAGGEALNAQRARVAQAFIWQGVTVKSGRVYLAAAHVGDLWDDVDKWPKDLDLDGFTYERFFHSSTRAKKRLKWLEKGSYRGNTFTPQPYTQAAKVLREMGHMGEARQILFERQRLLAAAQYWAGYRKGNGKYLFPLEKPLKDLQFLGRWGFDLLLRWVVGYGYRPLNAVICLAFLFLTATALAHAVWEEGSFAPNSDVILVSDGWQKALNDDCLPATQGCDPNPAATWSNDPQRGLDWDSFNRYGYAADLVIPVLNLGQTDAWAPSKDRGPWGLALWWGRWVLIAAGWIVTALGVAAMTGVMQRNKED